MKWPRSGDNPFLDKGADPTSATWVSLSWLANLRIDDADLAEGFREAADRIVTALESSPKKKHPDMLFMPVAFLYRHSFELQLKHIINLGLALGYCPPSKGLTEAVKGHNLSSLWHRACIVIVAAWPKGTRNDLNAAGVIIHKFHLADDSGQGFRYTKDTAGKPTLTKLPKSASLTHLRDTAEALGNLLGGCIDGLTEDLRMKAEMEEYYRGD